MKATIFLLILVGSMVGITFAQQIAQTQCDATHCYNPTTYNIPIDPNILQAKINNLKNQLAKAQQEQKDLQKAQAAYQASQNIKPLPPQPIDNSVQ